MKVKVRVRCRPVKMDMDGLPIMGKNGVVVEKDKWQEYEKIFYGVVSLEAAKESMYSWLRFFKAGPLRDKIQRKNRGSARSGDPVTKIVDARQEFENPLEDYEVLQCFAVE